MCASCFVMLFWYIQSMYQKVCCIHRPHSPSHGQKCFLLASIKQVCVKSTVFNYTVGCHKKKKRIPGSTNLVFNYWVLWAQYVNVLSYSGIRHILSLEVYIGEY